MSSTGFRRSVVRGEGVVRAGRLRAAVAAALRAAGRRAAVERLEARLVMSTFVVSTGADSGAGSLRQAILDANAHFNDGGVADRIEFNIPTTNPAYQPSTATFRVAVGASDLPTITDPAVVDGYTQPGAAANTLAVGDNAVIKIELRGPGVEVADRTGLRVTAGNTTIRGLAINGFGGAGIALDAAQGDANVGRNTVVGNFVGTTVNGAGLRENGVGVRATTFGNRIGGPAPADRNVLSGNVRYGVELAAGAGGDVVQGNYVGSDRTGGTRLPNRLAGVAVVDASDVLVGGAAAGEGNVIAGNDGNGVLIAGPLATDNAVQGNSIGVGANGVALRNEGNGVAIADGASGNRVGGVAGEAGPVSVAAAALDPSNLIASNGQAGVAVLPPVTVGVAAGTGNTIRGNRTFSNSGLGIDLGAGGVTLNDNGDPSRAGDPTAVPDYDSGPNRLQNFPVLTRIRRVLAGVEISGTLTSAADATYTIDLYVSFAADPSTYGEGQRYLGATTVTTGANGVGTFTFVTTAGVGGGAGRAVAATATSAAGDTSEFSVSATAPLNVRPSNVSAGGPYAINELQVLNLTATATANDTDPLAYSWDVNGDGVFGDATGRTPSVSWAQLQALGITNGPRVVSNVRVRVDDGFEQPVTSGPTSLSVKDLPPALTLTGDPTATTGQAYALGLAATDPNGDALRGWYVDWGDGVVSVSAALRNALPASFQQLLDQRVAAGEVTVQLLDGSPPTVTHTYAGPASRAITGLTADVDGGFDVEALGVTISDPPPPPPPPVGLRFVQLFSPLSPDKFVPVPVLSNDNSVDVDAYLTDRQAADPTGPLAVAVESPLTDPAAQQIFTGHKIQYVFGRFQGVTRVAYTRALADLVLVSGQSKEAFVGEFNVYPNASVDPTRPAGSTDPNGDAPLFSIRPANADYADVRGRYLSNNGNRAAGEALLPGSPDFRSPAQGNSGAPNVRSALFTLPIQRLTLTTLGVKGFAGVPGGAAGYAVSGAKVPTQRNVPMVARFDNTGNPALDSDADRSNGYAFVQNAATPSNGQLLSRGDFSALVLHYRLRGADSFVLPHAADDGATGVIGYGDAQERADANAGWFASNTVNQIVNRGNFNLANLTNVIGDANSNSGDVNPRSTELAGAVWSGVYDRAGTVDPATGRRKLMVLVSNLGNVQKIVDLPNNIGGFSTFKAPGSTSLDRFDDFSIAPGQHRLLNFSLQQSSRGRLEWVFVGDSFIGLDNNRNGIGGQPVLMPPTAARVQGTPMSAGPRATDLVRDAKADVLGRAPAAGGTAVV